ncbi:glycosyl hydrolase family 28-related protein [Pedobacter sp. KR3-3]|uniref:Glycosyl hydrolase family 28-related protein n=1 Tax=Pedobacter albus TaxID=3113905 RepID=A0ABU7I751_9SPHI|nr:glycosyl hydrolase family 28-related protein [Pedobacter sp. KR3-3]MEE1945290.1 glycosyl hydrolase family 28-related protein [Pedobacter sp. KR3-3]
MNKALSFLVLIVQLMVSPALAETLSSNTSISFGARSPHIIQISANQLLLASGNTYRFTVDTPEDKGLVSTRATVDEIITEIVSADGSAQQYQIKDSRGTLKNTGTISEGDWLQVTAQDGKTVKKYTIAFKKMALGGKLSLFQNQLTQKTNTSLTLSYTAGQRSPNATVQLFLPLGIAPTLNNTSVNVIGRGFVKLGDLSTQSIGRVGSLYSYSKVGEVAITKTATGSVITFKNLDLRPANGADLVLKINDINLKNSGDLTFKATYTTSEPEVLSSAGTGGEIAILKVTKAISNFERVLDRNLAYKETATSYTSVNFKWPAVSDAKNIQLEQSLNEGKTWTVAPNAVDLKTNTAELANLKPHLLYSFRLSVKDGEKKGYSNLVQFYTGKMDVKKFGVNADDQIDDTQKINEAIAYLNKIGGGTLYFGRGTYLVKTVHLQSNVYLFLAQEATIKAIKGADAPEQTWFSDKQYRSGLSPTAIGPYADPENYLTKQDVGHHYFRNAMFFGERLDNIKIIGNGRITGDGNLVNGDNVMNNAPDNRADKMFALKLCTNIEIGGLPRTEDLWYDPAQDEPYYVGKDGSKNFDTQNMLNIDRAGHFALLATGSDFINVHNTYFGRNSTSNVRDIYDFMACNEVTVTNIYCKVSSDDIVKPGSDCSLGFTRPARNYKVRNIIGDTNCNLFQVGSETVDDIMDICVDNIYVLGANKAGFSISTNDGGHIKNIHLNCGHTGTLHARSKMLRSTTPFFISISNRGRVLGAAVGKYNFTDNGEKHNELLVKNINIGMVENIIINGVDITEVYGGSSYGDAGNRWKAYDGKQRKASPIIAGYKLPDNAAVEGGLNFKLPNGQHTGYIKNVSFTDVHVLVKGGNAVADTAQTPPELGVGQYNVSNLKVQPSYGLWARHVKNLTVKQSSFNYEKRDSRYVIYLDDVIGAQFSDLKMVKPADNPAVIGQKNASQITIDKIVYDDDVLGKDPKPLSKLN